MARRIPIGFEELCSITAYNGTLSDAQHAVANERRPGYQDFNKRERTNEEEAEKRGAKMPRHFWLDDEQWAMIEQLLPQVHTGPERVDDWRIISGILHRFREVRPPARGPLQR